MKRENLHFKVDNSTPYRVQYFDYETYFGQKLTRPVSIEVIVSSITGTSLTKFAIGVTNTSPGDITDLSTITNGVVDGEFFLYTQPAGTTGTKIIKFKKEKFSEEVNLQNYKYVVAVSNEAIDTSPEFVLTFIDTNDVVQGQNNVYFLVAANLLFAYVGTLLHSPVVEDTFVATSNTAKSADDDGLGAITGDVDPGGNNTLNYATGAYDFIFDDTYLSVTATADYDYVLENQVINPLTTFGPGGPNAEALTNVGAGHYTGTLDLIDLEPSLFIATSSTGKIVTDDGAGNLIGDVDVGQTRTINYATGVYDFYFVDGAASATATANYQLKGIFQDIAAIFPWQPNTFTATSNTGKIVTDDGAGNIIGDVDPASVNECIYNDGSYYFRFVDRSASTSATATVGQVVSVTNEVLTLT